MTSIDKVEGLLSDAEFEKIEDIAISNFNASLEKASPHKQVLTAKGFREIMNPLISVVGILDFTLTDKILSPEWIRTYKAEFLIDERTGVASTPGSIVNSPLYTTQVQLTYVAITEALDSAVYDYISYGTYMTLSMLAAGCSELALSAETVDLKYTYSSILGSISAALMSVEMQANFGY